MTFLSRPSLFRRLLLVEILAAAVFWVLYAASTYYSIYEQGDGYLDRDLQLMAQAMARGASTHDDTDGMRRVVEHVRALNLESEPSLVRSDEIAFQVWDGAGTLLFRSADSPPLDAVQPGSIADGRRSRRGAWVVHGAYSPDRTIYAVAGYSDRALARLRLQLVKDASLAYLWVMAVLAFILWLAALIGLRPLRALAKQLTERGAEGLSQVHPPVRYAELQPLLDALNEKIAHVRALLEKERAFFVDAAHELRTPLAALEAQAHVVALESTPAGRMAALRALEQGVERAAIILNKLLLLGRLDSAAVESRDRTDVMEILRRQVRVHAPRAIANGARIELQGPACRQLWCEPFALETALDHLIDNALRYTPAGTLITVSLREEHATCVISVADDGPGIAEHERERVFDRFVRLDPERSLGSGLGLAIVRRIAHLHEGAVTLRAGEQGRGCVFELWIPHAGEAAAR